MATSHFRQFFDAATGSASGTDGLPGPGFLCGLHTSWCMLHGMTSRHDASFRSGTRMRCTNVHDSRLRMRGGPLPACIVSSYPRAVA